MDHFVWMEPRPDRGLRERILMIVHAAQRRMVSRVLIAGAAMAAVVSLAGFARAAQQAPQAQLAKPATVADLVARVPGEWEGSVQVCTQSSSDTRTSASIVGLSASASQQSASAVFAGAAFGKPFDGALVWNSVDASATWVIGQSKQAVRGALVSSTPGSLTFASAPEPIAGNAASSQRFEQVVRFSEEGGIRIELSRVVSSAQGQQREKLASIDVVKLPAGEPSLASGMAQQSPQLAIAQQASAPAATTVTASAGE